MNPIGDNELTEKIIGCAITVHRKLGPGFLESVYRAALAYELTKEGIPFREGKRNACSVRGCFSGCWIPVRFSD